MGGPPFVRPVGGLRRAGDIVRATRRGATVIVRPALAASVLPLNVFARDSYARSSPGCDCGFIFEGVCIAAIVRLCSGGPVLISRAGPSAVGRKPDMQYIARLYNGSAALVCD
ncbi:hypothetical protein K523DRAFT_39411 [Schizophyllum commune Tattone D]|nr:hypothetical protein K523DRAFT_39411 [Schizophyllum commune Tattone D]